MTVAIDKVADSMSADHGMDADGDSDDGDGDTDGKGVVEEFGGVDCAV